MKKKVEKEVVACDFCGRENTVMDKCLICGKDICNSCIGVHAVGYNDCVDSLGYHGVYCNTCDDKLLSTRSDKIHNAYTTIKGLNNKKKVWYLDFKRRCHHAETALNILLG